MKIAGMILLCLLSVASQAWAQSPAPAGVGPVMDASLGYSYMRSGTPSSTGIGLSGVDATLTEGITPRFSLRTDLSYLRASNVLGTGHHSDVLSYLVGPVFYPRRDRRLVTCVYGLAGGARVTGVFPRGSQYGRGFVNDFSWAFGGAYEYRVSDSMALRVSLDALHTSFFNASGVIQGRYDLRPVVGVVYYFGGRKR